MGLWNSLKSNTACICLVLHGFAACISACGNGMVAFNDGCYFFSHDVENWVDAENMCRMQFDGRLVEIETAQENAFINREIQSRLSVSHKYWLGASDVVQEGTWVWQSSHQNIRGPSYVHFQENNGGGNENCLEVNFDVAVGAWNDAPCGDGRHYICEVGPSTEVIG